MLDPTFVSRLSASKKKTMQKKLSAPQQIACFAVEKKLPMLVDQSHTIFRDSILNEALGDLENVMLNSNKGGLDIFKILYFSKHPISS